MTDPTPAPTPEHYENTADALCRKPSDDWPAFFQAVGEAVPMLRFAARRARQTCETCKFAGEIDSRRRTVFSDGTGVGRRFEGVRACVVTGRGSVVPLTVHGQPFGCAAHEVKPTSDPEAR